MYFGFCDISVNYGKNEILRGLTLDIPRSKIVTLIGQNGCGKSTLLKTVSRAVTPRRGEVRYLDKRLSSYPSKQLAQKIAVGTLVSYGRFPYSRFGHGAAANDSAIIRRALELTGLTRLKDRTLSTLSGGERQRAWIAMTVAQQPEILILDEPTTYLDISYQVEVLELIKHLNRTLGITIVMVLHDINLAARYSDCLAAIRGGTLFACGTPRETVTKDNLRSIFEIEADVYRDPVHDCPYFIAQRTTFGTVEQQI